MFDQIAVKQIKTVNRFQVVVFSERGRLGEPNFKRFYDIVLALPSLTFPIEFSSNDLSISVPSESHQVLDRFPSKLGFR
jgi:hypothetical protein